MVGDLSRQYDLFNEEFIAGTERFNQTSKCAFYKALDPVSLAGKRVLDLGCGDGFDLEYCQGRGAICFGIDSSKNMVSCARVRLPSATISCDTMEQLPFTDSSFDVLISRYAMQTSSRLDLVLREAARVLRPNGWFVYLVVHPLRQFLEKKKIPRDYFLSEVVDSRFFDGAITAREPTHTFNEYFSQEFLSFFSIEHFLEDADFPSAERINGDNYPCFFVVRARRLDERGHRGGF